MRIGGILDTYSQAHLYGESKRCMLVLSKPVADLSKGCAGRRTSHSILPTHPPRAIRELTPANAGRSQRDGAASTSSAPSARSGLRGYAISSSMSWS